jgi:hypothetical protein
MLVPELKVIWFAGTGEVYTEKAEMIEAIPAAGGSSHCTCAVCYEDCQNGDAMRVILC